MMLLVGAACEGQVSSEPFSLDLVDEPWFAAPDLRATWEISNANPPRR